MVITQDYLTSYWRRKRDIEDEEREILQILKSYLEDNGYFKNYSMFYIESFSYCDFSCEFNMFVRAYPEEVDSYITEFVSISGSEIADQ